MVADLHPPPGEQRHPAGKVSRLGAFGEVEVAALWTHLVVERVDRRVLAFADVAVLWFQRLSPIGSTIVVGIDLIRGRRTREEDVRGREYRLGPQGSNAGLVEGALVASGLAGLLGSAVGLDLAPTLLDIGRVDVAGGVQQTRALVQFQRCQQRTIGDDRFQ